MLHQITMLKDGSILHGGIDDTEFVIRQNYDEENAPWKYVKVKSARLILPTGDSYYFEIEGSLVWSAFDSADIKPSGYVIGYTFAENPTKRYPYIRCESSIRYVGSKKKPNIDLSPTSFRGILVNDRIYVWDHSKNNIGNATYQIFNNIVVPAAACDTVTAVEMRGVTDGFKVTYTRGDFAEFDGGGSVENASLHREGGIFTVRTVQYNPQFRLTYPDKSFFKGSFYELFTDYFEHYKFGLESFTPKTGIYVYPDGTTSNLTDGKNDRELAEEKAAYEAAEKRAAAAKAKAETEAWVTLSKKYGKTYCDYLRKNMQPCVGMPIDLVVGFFDCRLVYTSGYIKFYRLYGKYYGRDGGHYGALQGIYVRNGRVSSILNYRR